MKMQKLKSMALAAVAVLSFAAPIVVSTSAAADPPRQERRADDRADSRADRSDQRQWRRGDRPSASERRNWRNVDYRQHRFSAPPRGYHYVRDDRTGQYLLVGVASGVILSIIASR